jgi:hypothetical protein
MSGQSTTRTERVVLAQCTNQKRDGCHPARELYDESTYFRKQRAYAEAAADEWFIQSAEYGLVHPDEEIESYDTHAKDIDDAEAWAESIADDIEARVPNDATVEILGGRRYADPLTPELERRGFDVVEPLRGHGIGVRMSKLGDMAAPGTQTEVVQ